MLEDATVMQSEIGKLFHEMQITKEQNSNDKMQQSQ